MRNIAALSLATVAAAALLAGALFLQYQNTSTAAVSRNDIVVTNFQQDHGFVLQSSAGTQRDDPRTYALGEQSLMLTTDGEGSAVSEVHENKFR